MTTWAEGVNASPKGPETYGNAGSDPDPDFDFDPDEIKPQALSSAWGPCPTLAFGDKHPQL
jgi:hypothetical protein